MNLRKLLPLILFIAVGAGLVLASCKKSSNSGNNNSSDLEIAQDNTLSESIYNDVTTMVDQAALSGSVSVIPSSVESGQSSQRTSTLLSACASLTIDTVNSPSSITIDFGASNCLCKDLRNRRGKIIATFTGHYRDQGTVVCITVDNYFFNDNQISGTKTVTNMGLNNSGNLVYKVEVNGQIVKANNGGTITWVSTREREWVSGEDTPLNLLDDTYSITGTASGTDTAGVSYAITIQQPLVRKMNCPWFESGVLTVVPQGKAARTLDYGSTGCDANATLTILGLSFPIVLQ